MCLTEGCDTPGRVIVTKSGNKLKLAYCKECQNKWLEEVADTSIKLIETLKGLRR